MKRALVLGAMAAAFISNTAIAQLGVSKITKKVLPTLVLGAKVGVNLQQMTGSTTWDKSYKPGIVGGAFVSVDKKKMGVRVEVLIKTAKFDFSGASVGGSTYVNTVALDVPVLFEYKPFKYVWLQVGPQFTSLISAKHSNGVDAKGSFTNSDISAVGGVEVRLPMKLTVGARYLLGLANVNNTVPSTTWKNTSMQFSVGYRFLN